MEVSESRGNGADLHPKNSKYCCCLFCQEIKGRNKGGRECADVDNSYSITLSLKSHVRNLNDVLFPSD